MNREEMRRLIDDYRLQGAPQDQQMLIALLREIQEAEGGVIPRAALETAAEAFHLKETFLQAIVRRIPSLRLEDVPHRLEICATCAKGRALFAFLEKEYGAKCAAPCKEGGFYLAAVPCMKNCAHGPSIRWDGVLYSHADTALLTALIEKETGKHSQTPAGNKR